MPRAVVASLTFSLCKTCLIFVRSQKGAKNIVHWLLQLPVLRRSLV